MERTAEISRKTNETDIQVRIDLDGSGAGTIATGLPFMDHMLNAVARHGFFDLDVAAKGDLEIDAHHTLEDLGLALGQALRGAVGDKKGIRRYGWAILPMDDALVRVALDLSGRPFLAYRVATDTETVGGFNARLFREFFQALVNTAGMNLHIDLLAGEEVHHIFEAMFKAFAKALDQAVGMDERVTGVPSTKGSLD